MYPFSEFKNKRNVYIVFKVIVKFEDVWVIE